MLKTRLIMILPLTLGLVSCSGITVRSEYDPGTNFTAFATYAWSAQPGAGSVPQDPMIDELLLEEIQKAVDKEMLKKGIRKVSRMDASLLVTQNISVEQKLQFNDPYYTFDTVEQYEQGTLVLDFIDASTDQLVWRGIAEARLNEKSPPEDRRQRVADAVTELLAQYPPAKSSSQTDGGEVGAEASPPVESAAISPVPLAAGPLQRDAPGLTEAGLQIWNDPAFKRRFAESYVAVTEIEPTVTAEERTIMLKVFDLMQDNRLDDAARLLEEAMNDASSAVFDYTLANIYSLQERLDRAAVFYQRAIERHRNRNFRRAFGNLGLIHFRQEKFRDAVDAFTRVIELGGGDGFTYGLLGIAYSRLGNYISAETAFRQATLLDAGNPDWKRGLAESYFRQQRFADAVALGDILIAEQPDNGEFWLIQGKAYVGLEKPLEAAENLEMVDRLGASTVDSLNLLADIYANEGLYDLAVNSYLRALEKDPVADVSHALRAGKFLTANEAHAEARMLVEGIESLRSDQLGAEEHKDILRLRALLAAADEASDEEVAILEELVAVDPTDGSALIQLGQHFNLVGDPEKAIFYFERAASFDRFEANAKLRHGQLLVGQGKYSEALPYLRRVQALEPSDNLQDYLDQVERIARSR